MSVARPVLRPARTSGALAVLVGLGVLFLFREVGITTTLLVEAAGLAVLAAGLALVQRDWRLVGGAVTAAGSLVVLVALGLLFVGTAGDLLVIVQFLPGLLGVVAVALGVVPARGRGSRRLVTLGAAALFLSVLLVGIVQRPPVPLLLSGGVATVLVWDAGENAVGVGSQLGRRAETRRLEAVHLGATALVGVVAVVVGTAVTGVGTGGLSLSQFVLLLTALLLLAGSLHG